VQDDDATVVLCVILFRCKLTNFILILSIPKVHCWRRGGFLRGLVDVRGMRMSGGWWSEVRSAEVLGVGCGGRWSVVDGR
jgi:hypothetical protein